MRRGDQHEVARLQRHRLAPVDREAARAVEDHAIERPPGFGAAHAPGTGAADDFGERRLRLEQRDHLGERINHNRTPADKTWTPDCSKSGCGGL